MNGGSWRINTPLQGRTSMIVALESHLHSRGGAFALLHGFSGAKFVDPAAVGPQACPR
jgi:hypothetical protein